MDTFTAVPTFIRVPITVIDHEKFEEWKNSTIDDSPPPTITKIVVFYTKGAGTPVPVQIEVERIETEYSQMSPTEKDQQDLTAFEYVDKWRRVNMLLRRNLLLAVSDNKLDVEDANVLAQHDEGEGRTILMRTGWLQSRTETETEPETDDVENKAQGNLETGESTLLISPQPIQASTSRQKK